MRKAVKEEEYMACCDAAYAVHPAAPRQTRFTNTITRYLQTSGLHSLIGTGGSDNKPKPDRQR